MRHTHRDSQGICDLESHVPSCPRGAIDYGGSGPGWNVALLMGWVVCPTRKNWSFVEKKDVRLVLQRMYVQCMPMYVQMSQLAGVIQPVCKES